MSPPKRFILNVGGTKFEVSDSLLDQFPNSMLRRLTSEAWNEQGRGQNVDDDSEIFIERNGLRFQYILDYMRDATVSLPFAIPRAQFIADLEYYNIDYDDSMIKLSVADPKDLFYDLASYRDFFDATKKDIDERFRQVAVEKVACELASEYFERLGRPGRLCRSDNKDMRYGRNDSESKDECVSSYFVPTELCLPTVQAPNDISIQDIEPLMEKEYGLNVNRVIKERRSRSSYYGGDEIIYSEREVAVGLMSRKEKQRD